MENLYNNWILMALGRWFVLEAGHICFTSTQQLLMKTSTRKYTLTFYLCLFSLRRTFS